MRLLRFLLAGKFKGYIPARLGPTPDWHGLLALQHRAVREERFSWLGVPSCSVQRTLNRLRRNHTNPVKTGLVPARAQADNATGEGFVSDFGQNFALPINGNTPLGDGDPRSMPP